MPNSKSPPGSDSLYRGVAEIFAKYWSSYGGVRALIKSPYLHAAFFLLIVTAHRWLFKDWWTDVTSVIPSLLGFTLGGFAVFIGFGDEKFRQLLAEPDVETQDTESLPVKNPHSIYTELCSTFVHFIVIQCLALLYAIVFESLQFYSGFFDSVLLPLQAGKTVFGALGYLLYLYALTSVLAVTMHLFRIATMYEEFQKYRPPSK